MYLLNGICSDALFARCFVGALAGGEHVQDCGILESLTVKAHVVVAVLSL